MPHGIAVVDDVLAGIVVEIDAAVGALVVVLQREPGHHAGDVGRAFEHRTVHGPGILRVGPDHVEVARQAPLGGEVVRGLDHPARGAESGVRAVAGGAVVAEVRDQREAAVGVLLGHVAAEGPVGAAHQLDIDAVAQEVGAPGDDVDGAAHRIGAVEDGGSAARDFHALGQVGEVFIGHGVAVDGHILRVSVDQDQGPAAAGAEAAQRDAAGCTGGHAIAGHPAGSHEQARDLLHQGGHQGTLVAGGNPCAPDHGDGSGHTVALHRHAGAGHDGAAQGIDKFFFGLCRSRLQEGCSQKRCEKGKDTFHRMVFDGCKVTTSRAESFD